MVKRNNLAWRAAPAALTTAAWLLGSCVSYDVTRIDNYVGPGGVGVSAVPASATGPATQPADNLPAVPVSGPIRLNVYQAIVVALNHNRALIVDQYNPPLRRTFEEEELAAFDPVLSGQITGGRTHGPYQGTVGNAAVMTNAAGGQVQLTEFLPTGTRLAVAGTSSVLHTPAAGEADISRVGLTATQSLLRGYGLDVNLASLHQARIDTLRSEYELRGLAEAIVAQTEEAYWDYVLAQRRIEIVTQSLQLAQQQLDDANFRIAVGSNPPTDRVVAQAEVALRRQDLIDANSALARTRVLLLRLINPPGEKPLEREIVVEEQPIAKDLPLDPLEQHLELAGRRRPDLNQARLLVNRDELDIVRTRNGLLPRLDLFVTLGRSGYADTFGRSLGQLFDGDNYDALIGVSGDYPLGNRAPRAQVDRAVMTRDQSMQAVRNLEQLVEVDVRIGYIEVLRTREQLSATAASRRLQEEKLRAEKEKYRQGARSATALTVAQVQRDLLASQIAEVQAVASCLKAYVELYRLEGSLLDRRGIAAPGKEPVQVQTKR